MLRLAGVDLTGMRAGQVQGPLGTLKQWNFIVFNVNAPAEQQEAGIEYFNWLTSSQDNMDLWLMGIDGVNYKKEDNLKFSEIDGRDAGAQLSPPVVCFWRYRVASNAKPADLPQEAEERWPSSPPSRTGTSTRTKASRPTPRRSNWIRPSSTGSTTKQRTVSTPARNRRRMQIQKMKTMLDEAGRQEYKAKLQKQLDDYIAAHKA